MPERVQKLLASAGTGSRRRVEELIRSGAVTVNGKVCKLGDKAGPEDTITVSGKKVDCGVSPGETGLVIAYNKPVGKIVSSNDSVNRPTVFEDLPPLKKARWVPVGRLDLNTSGLLIFCSDGLLAHRLAHPSSEIEREYLARVRGNTGKETTVKLLAGVVLDGKPGRFEKIVSATPPDVKNGNKSNKWFRITVKEGRNRFVRRMWESRRCEVSRLVRIRFGPVKLPKNLPAGACFFLDKFERRKLYRTAGIKTSPV